MTTLNLLVIGGPLLIFVADMIIYIAVGKLGKRSSGKGNKYPTRTAPPPARPELCTPMKAALITFQRSRYMSLETIAPLSDDPIIKLPAVAA